MRLDGRFVVVCAGCAHTLMVVARIGDPEATVLLEHLRGCRASDPLGERASLEEIMRRVHVSSIGGR